MLEMEPFWMHAGGAAAIQQCHFSTAADKIIFASLFKKFLALQYGAHVYHTKQYRIYDYKRDY